MIAISLLLRAEAAVRPARKVETTEHKILSTFVNIIALAVLNRQFGGGKRRLHNPIEQSGTKVVERTTARLRIISALHTRPIRPTQTKRTETMFEAVAKS